jgi:type II secretory pathway pseudopilin PulG
VDRQSGITLFELLFVVALSSLTLGVTASYTLPLHTDDEDALDAAEAARTFAQLARLEAIHRNRSCSLIVDPAAGTLRVVDSMGTAQEGDDEVLYERALAAPLTFDRPDGSRPPENYETVFSALGTAQVGSADLVLHDGVSYGKLSIPATGLPRVERWAGSAWTDHP